LNKIIIIDTVYIQALSWDRLPCGLYAFSSWVSFCIFYFWLKIFGTNVFDRVMEAPEFPAMAVGLLGFSTFLGKCHWQCQHPCHLSAVIKNPLTGSMHALVTLSAYCALFY